MNKSPEQYFQDQNFSTDAPEVSRSGEFTEAERAFMEKYLGMDGGETLRKIGIEAPSLTDAPEAGPQPPAAPPEERLDDILRREQNLLLVGFYVGSQEFVVPTLAVQEVIRYMSPTKLPAAQRFVAGVINLRGKVTPLVRLRDILEIPAADGARDEFTIVCRRQGLQLGLMIEKVHTMYRVSQEDIDWAVEAHLGNNAEFIAGLLKLRDSLVGIVSVDKIVDTIIKR